IIIAIFIINYCNAVGIKSVCNYLVAGIVMSRTGNFLSEYLLNFAYANLSLVKTRLKVTLVQE
ncbi:TPA: hypothetical protein ACWYFB_003371, partial [Morganella morganii]